MSILWVFFLSYKCVFGIVLLNDDGQKLQCHFLRGRFVDPVIQPKPKFCRMDASISIILLWVNKFLRRLHNNSHFWFDYCDPILTLFRHFRRVEYEICHKDLLHAQNNQIVKLIGKLRLRSVLNAFHAIHGCLTLRGNPWKAASGEIWDSFSHIWDIRYVDDVSCLRPVQMRKNALTPAFK